mmetsp:Transcript_10549/g.25188  ORF Transcript_10549/g.25188 Transcript_10549/m.25188 type:complete len:133 (+) Transcript_10549:252-650(+)
MLVQQQIRTIFVVVVVVILIMDEQDIIQPRRRIAMTASTRPRTRTGTTTTTTIAWKRTSRERINFLYLRVAATEEVEEVLGGSSNNNNEPRQVVDLTNLPIDPAADTAAAMTGAVLTTRIREEELYRQQLIL